MKMKEVCDKTGLTERAVRFYVAKGLVSPELIVRNDREYREYSREDVQTLRDISDLRKLSFSIEEILSMQKSPERIAEVLSVRRAALRKEQKDRETILASLSRMDGSGMQSIHQLAEQFRSVSASLPNPDIAFRFDRLEDLEAEEKECAWPRRRRSLRTVSGRLRKKPRWRSAILPCISSISSSIPDILSFRSWPTGMGM